MIGQYTQQLFSKGQSRLSDFENKNSLLLEKLDYMMLKLEFSDVEQHGKAKSLRNRMVRESYPYKGKFRKIRVEYQNLLSCLFNSQPPAAVAPTVVAQTRKEYGFLKPKPCMIHRDCTKKELLKFIGKGKKLVRDINDRGGKEGQEDGLGVNQVAQPRVGPDTF